MKYNSNEKIVTPLKQFMSEFMESKLALCGFAIFCILIIIAILAPWISIQNPYDLSQLNIVDSSLPPGSVGSNGNIYPLGTDEMGRDLLSAILYGLRVSFGVGIGSSLIALIIGIILGLLAGYFGGIIDKTIMRAVELFLAIPSFLIALILLAILGRGVENVIIALVICQWAQFARLIRGVAIVEKEKEYVVAAKCLILPTIRIIFKHILPQCLPSLIVVGTVNIAFSINLEASLSFLGVGTPITKPSLGLLIANGFKYILSGKYWISFYPGLVLLLTIFSINLVTDHLRDVLNPRLKE